MFGSGREGEGQDGIAGLGSSSMGSTIAGLPAVAVPGEETPRPLPEWPLILVLAVIAIGGAWIGIGSQWGEAGADRSLRIPGLSDGLVALPKLPGTPSESSIDYRRPAALAEGLAAVRKAAGPGSRSILMRIDSGQVWAVVSRRDGRQLAVRVAGGETKSNPTTAGGFAGVPLAGIDARAPSRMLAALAADHGVGADRVDYFVLSDDFEGAPVWNVYLEARPGTLPRWFRANASGRKLVRAG